MGCDQTATIRMFLVLALLIITLANCEARDHKLPSDLKSTFEEINEEYNTHMKWDADLADKAAKEALTPYHEGAYLKIRGQKEFSKKDESTLADRLHLILKNPFKRMGNRVSWINKMFTTSQQSNTADEKLSRAYVELASGNG
ncbi:unnamed protein product [Haemonchus placei]|uniref:Uncharacterized protein n=1 Tax=Haemonchus placei TaxID=6290 RepID=A0A0N4W9I8_HAEPC|nr:unnamed protein product [Haemonchus placei]